MFKKKNIILLSLGLLGPMACAMDSATAGSSSDMPAGMVQAGGGQ